MNLLDLADSALHQTEGANATPEQQRELERLIARILPHDTQAERDWTLSIAVRDPENALTSFRALAARSRYGHE